MKKAFTLVELLVVIAIIGILSTLSVVALNSARAKARDARRLSDIKQIRTALDMYYDSAGTYPTSLIPGSHLSYNGLDFLAKVPDDPLSSQHYIYTQTENGQNYTIDFTLETKSAGYEPGNYQATPYAIVAGGSGGVFQCGDLLAYDGGPLNQDGYFTGNGGYYLTRMLEPGQDCWLMNNLNAGVFNSSDPDYGDKRCYEDNQDYCDQEGGLYTVSQGELLCPPGWSLPTLYQIEEGEFRQLDFYSSGFWDNIPGEYINTAWLVINHYEGGMYYFYREDGNFPPNVFLLDRPSGDAAASVRCVKDN